MSYVALIWPTMLTGRKSKASFLLSVRLSVRLCLLFFSMYSSDTNLSTQLLVRPKVRLLMPSWSDVDVSVR